MADVTTSTNPEVLKQYWRDEFLKEFESNLVFKQLGLMGQVPEGTGVTVNWFSMANLTAGPTITEGTDPAGSNLTTSFQSATLEQKGDFVSISDVQMRQAAPDFMDNVMSRMGRAAAQTYDTHVRDTIFSAGGLAQFGGTAAFRNSIANDAAFDLDIAEIRKAVNTLERVDARPHNMASDGANFVGIIGPDAKYDLVGDSNWVDIAVNTSPNVDRIKGNIIGSLYNVSFMETSEALTLTNSGSANTDVVQTYIVSDEYFGVSEAVGTEIITRIPAPESELELRGTVAYKYLTALKELHPSAMVRIETSTAVESRA